MTVIGIAGCTALLLVGFGLHDAIWDIINKQYVDITHYQMTVGLNDHANDLTCSMLKTYLTNIQKLSISIACIQHIWQQKAKTIRFLQRM